MGPPFAAWPTEGFTESFSARAPPLRLAAVSTPSSPLRSHFRSFSRRRLGAGLSNRRWTWRRAGQWEGADNDRPIIESSSGQAGEWRPPARRVGEEGRSVDGSRPLQLLRCFGGPMGSHVPSRRRGVVVLYLARFPTTYVRTDA